MLEQQGSGCLGIALEAYKLFGIGQSGGACFQADHQLAALHTVARAVNVRAFLQRCAAVEHIAAILNHFGAALGVVARAFFAAVGFTQGIGAIQRVIQRTPTSVGGVQGIASIQNRHHQLGASQHSQLCIHILGAGFEVFGLGHQVANRGQMLAISLHGFGISQRTGVSAVPLVHVQLNAIALGQQGQVHRRQVFHDAIKA